MSTCDSTLELEEDMKKLYPHMFSSKSNFWGQKFCCCRECKYLENGIVRNDSMFQIVKLDYFNIKTLKCK